MSEEVAPTLAALRERALQRLSVGDAGASAKIEALAIASDFAIDTLAAQPELLPVLLGDANTPMPPPVLNSDNRDAWPRLLRRYRHAESTRLVWRDVVEGASVDEILAGSTLLAETCLESALVALEADFEQRYGVVCDGDGQPQRLVVFGLGKLGGRELNFSSDVDLVYAYEHEGASNGARSLHAQDYFARLGQQLAKLLDEATADGFCHRVDLRLRPFGSAGRIALSFVAMEQYYQREGRDWERYAWQKARPVAGDLEAGARLQEALRPFVYRRYLDYGALDGLRSMKAMIAAEVARRELDDDIKRGAGGIREIEFLVQALQLIRGGRERELRGRQLLPMLHALVQAGHIQAEAGALLADAYRFLRRLENRIQMLADAQTHVVPSSAVARARIAGGLGYSVWDELAQALALRREQVAEEFGALLAPRRARSQAASDLAAYWRGLPDAGDAQQLEAAGFPAADRLHASLCDFARAPGVRALSDRARTRLDRVLPVLLQAATESVQPDAVMGRVLPLLHNLLRRTSYLALLDEQLAALQRLVAALARSALLGERLAAYPLLLDELLDVRVGSELPDALQLRSACEAALGENDTEAALDALNEVRQALSFRLALALLDRRIDAQDCARRLAWLADAVVTCVLHLSVHEVQQTHGRVPEGRFAVLGYGSLGGEELGFGSDLDLVFLFDAPDGAMSDGTRSLDAARWYVRLGQKIVALLGVRTSAGRLFDVDVRLRPDGAKGLLVSSVASFSDYQRTRAWTWEHQALVRARAIAGDAALLATFEQLRGEVLSAPRDPVALREDVSKMRRKMRAELDRTDALQFDLKQGEGGLVDLEFLLQYLVLAHAAACPELLQSRSTPALLTMAHGVGLIDEHAHPKLLEAHALLLNVGLHCTLDRRPRRAAADAHIEAARASVREQSARCGLQFGG